MTITDTNTTSIDQEQAALDGSFLDQEPMVQGFIDTQAKMIALDLVANKRRIKFNLPDRMTTHIPQFDHLVTVRIPNPERARSVSTSWSLFGKRTIKDALSSHLRAMEQSQDQAIAACGALYRYRIATALVSQILPNGKNVHYHAIHDEAIPSIPDDDHSPNSAITQASDAIGIDESESAKRGELQTPFHPDARLFFLPKWVAFSLDQRLIAKNRAEAEAMVRSMQNYIEILHIASSLSPTIVTNTDYTKKRQGILGQLINQGRALANYLNDTIINDILEREKNGTLNRGLSLSLPYFNDQALKMAEYKLQVIPAGRIMFIPAFVVRATKEEMAKIQQDTRLNASTKRQLINQLQNLQKHFVHRKAA